MTGILNEAQPFNENSGIDPHPYNINGYNEDEEGIRINISVLLPEQFARRLNLSVNKRTPVLDLIVYLSSLFRFNPADYVLGYVDNDDKKGFRVLLPNSSIGSTGSTVLQLAQKKQVMVTFFEDGGCLRHAYSTKNTDNIQAMDKEKQLISLNIILPDGGNVVMNESEDCTLGELFATFCKQQQLDPNCYTLQILECNHTNGQQILTSSMPLSSINSNTLQLITTLKSCNVAESESSVDKMSKRNVSNNKKSPVNSILANSAVKALVAGTMMSDVTEGLGLKSNTMNKLDERKLDHSDSCCHKGHSQRLCTTFDGMRGFSTDSEELAAVNLQNINSCFPRGQNSLDFPEITRNRKHRAPLPPVLRSNQNQCDISYPQHNRYHAPHVVDRHVIDRHHFGYSNGRVQSATSTVDDISEDFRQAIQIGSTTAHICNKAIQTNETLKFKPNIADQQIQTTPDLLTTEDVALSKFNNLSSLDVLLSSKKVTHDNRGKCELPHLASIIKQNYSLYDHKHDFRNKESTNKSCNSIAIADSVKSDKNLHGESSKPIFISKTTIPTKHCVYTQSNNTSCKKCLLNEQKKISPKRKGILGKMQLNKHHSQSTKRVQNLMNIITEQEQLSKQMIKKKIKPIELEVKEKTTTVECTVTVTSEGKSISASARPLQSSSNENALGPRPYVKDAEYRKIKSFADLDQ